MSRELSPAVAAVEVDDNDSARSSDGGVSDVSHACLSLTQVKADIVDVGRQKDRGRRQYDRFYDLVRRQVHSDELRTATERRRKARRGGVENPEPIHRIDDNALHASKRLAGAGGIKFVDQRVRIGNDLAVADLADGEWRIIAPAREVDEDAAIGGDAHASRHCVVELEHRLDMSNRAVARELLR